MSETLISSPRVKVFLYDEFKEGQLSHKRFQKLYGDSVIETEKRDIGLPSIALFSVDKHSYAIRTTDTLAKTIGDLATVTIDAFPNLQLLMASESKYPDTVNIDGEIYIIFLARSLDRDAVYIRSGKITSVVIMNDTNSRIENNNRITKKYQSHNEMIKKMCDKKRLSEGNFNRHNDY